ncbi:MAG: NB-ARC domain-containing protein, partial [bacterium]
MLYVVAHGAADPNTFGRLALVGDALTGSDLKRMLEDTAATARPCRAVLLCACSGALAQPGLWAETTGMAQALAQHAVEAAIGFRAPVGVAWALGFMERLFDHLGHDPDLEGAFARVRAMLPEHDPQWPLLAYYGRPLAPAPAGRPGVEAPSTGALPASELPAPSRWFTAREVELRRLDALLRTPGAAVIHALEGEGGVGKTELARVAADRLAGERPVIWLDRPDRDVRAALDALLAAGTGKEAAAFRDVPDDALAALVRTLLAGRGGLLVLDDVADGDALGPLLPGSNWNVLVTTRVAALLPDADRVEVGPLAPVDARLLFCRVAWGVDDPPSGEAEALSGLLADLGGLPLALELAAESVNQGARVADYRAGLGQDFGRAWADQARLRTVLARTLDELGADERAAFEALGALPVSGA